MSDDKLAKLKERDHAMRKARDEMLRRVAMWLVKYEFAEAGAGHFIRAAGNLVCHIGFQKLSSGRNVRVMCHVSKEDNNSVAGPWSDPYECPNSPNGRKYHFGWSTREPDVARCAAEYCKYIEDVVFEWFEKQVKHGSNA